MRYFGILKDSLLEAIDSKVFYVVGAISILAIGLMATLELKPTTSDEGFQKITSRFKTGADEVDLPIVGKIKVTPSLAEHSVKELKGAEGSPKPWEAEYQLIIETRDLIPLGGRIVVLQQILEAEEEKELLQKTGRKTRLQKIREEVKAELEKIVEQEEKKGRGRMETQQQILDRLNAFAVKRLEEEIRSLSDADLEKFIKDQLELQGNWRVTEVKIQELPPAEKNIKIKTRVPIQEGEDIRFKMEEKPGEINRYTATVTPRGATYLGWPHKATVLFGAQEWGDVQLPGEIVSSISTWFIFRIGAPVIMLLSCIITAFYIPNMLRKGTVDLLLAKPISRTGLLCYKFIGGMTFMVLNTTVLIIGLWVVLGLRTAVWEPAFLYSILILTFEFALFYALSTLAAVLTRSPIVCILGCILMWAVLFPIGGLYYRNCLANLGQPEGSASAYRKVMVGIHAVTPHYMDLDWLGLKELKERTLPKAEHAALERENSMFNWSESILVTSLYIFLFLGLACWRFSTQDF